MRIIAGTAPIYSIETMSLGQHCNAIAKPEGTHETSGLMPERAGIGSLKRGADHFFEAGKLMDVDGFIMIYQKDRDPIRNAR